MTFIPFLNVNTWKTLFHHFNDLYENIYFDEESNGELASLDTLLKRNNAKIFVLVLRTPTHTDQYWHCNSHWQISSRGTVASSLFNRAYYIITNAADLNK